MMHFIQYLCFMVFFSAFLQTVQAANFITTRVTVDSNGNEANSGSGNPSISCDGRYVAFRSAATNLVSDDTNGYGDVFVHDRQTGQTTRVSVDSDGNEANDYSGNPSISCDGRYVAFNSIATNLVINDNNDENDIFVHDRQTGETIRVNVDSSGNEANDHSQLPVISSDGKLVAFNSTATNLVSDDNNNTVDAFVHDLQNGETTRVSVDSDGNEAKDSSYISSFSSDSKFVGFYSFANNLVVGDTNNKYDAFVYDLQNGETTPVSVDSNGNEANGHSVNAAISTDGRYVAFQSEATNLVIDDTNDYLDVFVHDRQTGQTTRVSVDSDGNEADRNSFSPDISNDGRYVLFTSWATNLVSDDNNNTIDAFIHDQQTGQTTRVTVDSNGNEANSGSDTASFSDDGNHVTFASYATNLVSDDTNGKWDVFVREPAIGTKGLPWLMLLLD